MCFALPVQATVRIMGLLETVSTPLCSLVGHPIKRLSGAVGSFAKGELREVIQSGAPICYALVDGNEGARQPNSRACSSTSERKPWRAGDSAAARPPMPAPAIATGSTLRGLPKCAPAVRGALLASRLRKLWPPKRVKRV